MDCDVVHIKLLLCCYSVLQYIGDSALFGQTVPMYISEMAPPKMRGGLGMLFQLMATVGIFLASVITLGAPSLD